MWTRPLLILACGLAPSLALAAYGVPQGAEVIGDEALISAIAEGGSKAVTFDKVRVGGPWGGMRSGHCARQ